MRPHHLYLAIALTAFVVLAAVMLALPRSTYSKLEKRDLKTLPELTWASLADNSFTSEVSSWFSDTEPLRDEFMTASMEMKRLGRVELPQQEQTVRIAAQPAAAPQPEKTYQAVEQGVELPEGVAKVSNSGIIIVGQEPEARALMMYGGEASGGTKFAQAVNDYAAAMPEASIYCMVVPNATEFYLPKSASGRSKPQLPTIKNIYAHFDSTVHAIDAHGAIKQHTHEDIYMRTDHHWAPLGAFYAAREFARIASVPFPPLSSYEKREIKRTVGSMYGYSGDAAIKRSPETFTYFVPKTTYTTTYTDYTLDKNYKVEHEGKPHEGPYFQRFHDGTGNAYLTFMGSDQRLTVVKTSAQTPRKLLVVKDSYGNALPGYMFHSFSEVHVVDFRYFNHSLPAYVKDHGITDLLVAVNVYNAYSPSVAQKLRKMLR